MIKWSWELNRLWFDKKKNQINKGRKKAGFDRFVNNESISKMFSCDGARGFFLLFGRRQACAARPRVLMRWWMGAYGLMEALDPPVTANFKGRFIKRGPALTCTFIEQCRGPVKMNGGNYQLYLLTAILAFSAASWGSRPRNLSAWWADALIKLLSLLIVLNWVWSERLFHIILMLQHCCAHLTQNAWVPRWMSRSARWHQLI